MPRCLKDAGKDGWDAQGQEKWLVAWMTCPKLLSRYVRVLMGKGRPSLNSQLPLHEHTSACAWLLRIHESSEACKARAVEELKNGKWGWLQGKIRYENHLLQMRCSLWVLSRQDGKFLSARWIRVVGSSYNCSVGRLINMWYQCLLTQNSKRLVAVYMMLWEGNMREIYGKRIMLIKDI